MNYEFPEETFATIIGTYADLDRAKEELEEVVRDYYDRGEGFPSKEDFEKFLDDHWHGGKECFSYDNEVEYMETNIIHTVLVES